jgi:hypothetical protein
MIDANSLTREKGFVAGVPVAFTTNRMIGVRMEPGTYIGLFLRVTDNLVIFEFGFDKYDVYTVELDEVILLKPVESLSTPSFERTM